jgi:hypothetical protein
MGKTGTSALQATLDGHRPVLADVGVLYPKALHGRPNHNHLTCLISPIERLPRDFRDRPELSADAVRKLGSDLWEAVRRQVNKSDADTVILSAEFLFNITDDAVRNLHALTTELFSDVCVVAYVREPASYYLSLIQQVIKRSATVVPPGRYRVPWRACLGRYLEVFDGQVEVRAFERSRFPNGSIVADFVQAFLPDRPELVDRLRVENRNESLSGEAMCIMQDVLRNAWAGEELVRQREVKTILRTLEDMRSRWPQTPATLKPHVSASLSARNQADVAWLQQQFDVTFQRQDPVGPPQDEATDLMSGDLMDILELDRSTVELTTFRLIRELSESVPDARPRTERASN